MSYRLLVCFAVAGVLLAQDPGNRRNYGSPSGFGNILFPGTGSAPPLRPSGPSFGQRLSGTINGNVLPGPNYGNAQGRRGTVVVPYAVPVYVGGYGYGYYPQQEPNVTIVQQAPIQPQASAPAVIINQYYTPDTPRPSMREYPDGSLPGPSGEPPTMTVRENGGHPFPDPADLPERRAARAAASDKPIIYLIAFKSGAIYPALAYWVEEDTLHYITKDKSLNKASLELIDRELSAQLNGERSVEFKLK